MNDTVQGVLKIIHLGQAMCSPLPKRFIEREPGTNGSVIQDASDVNCKVDWRYR
jgi:hypothetical protein